MAFVTTQTNCIPVGGSGSPPLLMITGTYLSSAGDTGGVLAPGYTNSSGTFTAVSATGGSPSGIGGRAIVGVAVTPTLSDATAPGGAISYDTTLDSQIFTLVTTANTGGVYTLWCLDNGQ